MTRVRISAAGARRTSARAPGAILENVHALTREQRTFRLAGNVEVIEDVIRSVGPQALVVSESDLSESEIVEIGKAAKYVARIQGRVRRPVESGDTVTVGVAGYSVTTHVRSGKVEYQAIAKSRAAPAALDRWLIEVARKPASRHADRVDMLVLESFDSPTHDSPQSETVEASRLPAAVPADLHERFREARDALVKRYGPLYPSRKLHELAHSTAQNKSLVAQRLLTARDIFYVEHHGERGFFPFQFDPRTGKPLEVIGRIVRAFPRGVDGWRIAFWLTSPNARLDGQVPLALISVLDNHDRLVRVAEAEQTSEPF